MIKTITVNGRAVTISAEHKPNRFGKYEISYADLCSLVGISVAAKPTITWRAGEFSGSLSPGGVVNMKENMIFNVTNTGGA